MTLDIHDPDIDRLANEVATLTGESPSEAVRIALAERLERERLRRRDGGGLAQRLLAIGRHCASLPDLDPRSPDEIVGYDEHGAPR